MQSTTVEGSPPGVCPPSRMRWIRPLNWAYTSAALRTLGWPERLAEVTARGPVRCKSARATGWSGIRTPTVGSGERLAGNAGCAGTTRVSGPGQKRCASRAATCVQLQGYLGQVSLASNQHGNGLGRLTAFNLVELLYRPGIETALHPGHRPCRWGKPPVCPPAAPVWLAPTPGDQAMK